jgi:hypothetical protein
MSWHYIRELYKRKEVDLKFVQLEDNESNILYKEFPRKCQDYKSQWHSASQKGS